ncbi:peptide/nickel transport system substrate-binding protein [Rathayibacter sp. PhB93]|uniref:ABC transporter substrate-binding protein n=1 Tax=unclassified Rathayibacter TaxID=2609250 RepID=UPI000F46155A|nr:MULTISPECIES: ABC transporter substrate-binding protein [unclassified Rathayibacter]ROQ00947.1 peptide/nickel transport system substrate-binding protein [Rathayibacter sp. PhB93]TDQ07301.1 peptide/nickel transport system substrate-binding protein [Rathayibacter sp. PhB1]
MKVASALKAVAVAAVVAIALAGCTAGGSSGGSGGGEQTLHLSQGGTPSNFTIGEWGGGENLLSTAVYDTLITMSPDGELLPGIAESWEYDDSRTALTLDIRSGMTFTDGEKLDAEAVAGSLEALRKGTVSQAAWARVASVEATDESTVVVTLSAPDAAFLPALTNSNGAVGAPEVLTDASSQLEPVGSGPYILNTQKTVAGSKYVLDRNPDHWNVDSYPFEHVEVSILADPTATQNALRSGQLDVLGAAENADQYPAAQFDSGPNKPTSMAILWLSDRAGTIVPALADMRVRQAINLAFDRDTIASNLIGDGSSATNQVVSDIDSAYSEDLLDFTPYDVEKAKALMAEAGYADGFTVTMPSTPYSLQYESVITQSLADIGITVNYESVALTDFFTKVATKNYAMYFMYNGTSGDNALDIKNSLGGIFDPFTSATPELTQLIATADAAPDEDQAAAWGDVNEYLVQNAWNAPLNQVNGFWVASKKVTYTAPTQYNLNLLPYAPAGE